MFSSMFGIRPNPNYKPGGTENFWITSNSDYQKMSSGSNTLSSSQNMSLEKSTSIAAGSKEFSGGSSSASLPREKSKEEKFDIQLPGLQVCNRFCFNMIQNSWTPRKKYCICICKNIVESFHLVWEKWPYFFLSPCSKKYSRLPLTF